MTIVSSLDYTPTFRERQEYEVMMVLEEAIKSGEAISAGVLAGRVMNTLDALEPFDDEADVFDASVPAVKKPRVRVSANTAPVSRASDLALRQAAQDLLDSFV